MKEGLPLVIVQPGLVYGPGDTSSVRPMLIQYLTRKLPIMPLETAFAWAHIDDIARGHILAMEKGVPGETYIIAGEVYTLVDALRLAEKITGIPAPRVLLPPAALKITAALVSLIEEFVDLPESYTSEGLRVTAGATYLGTNAKARRELGYNPRALEVGLRETLEHEMNLLAMKK
jgi:nucleoside-diphosphate-sugar epimerase